VQQIGIFMSVTVASLVLFQLASGLLRPSSGKLRRRLAREASVPVGAGSGLYKDLDFEGIDHSFEGGLDHHESDLSPLAARTLRNRFDDLARQAAIPLRFERFLGLSACCGIITGVGAFFLAGGIAAILLGLVATFVPLFLLNIRRKWRRERMLNQLAGAFELMARVLRAGQSVPEALRAVVEAFEDPVSGEFAQALHEIEMGLRPEAAFKSLGRRSPVMELRIFVIAMSIHRQTGGNLSELLDRLAVLIRTRIRIRQKIRSLTAEGRMQSVALLVLPPLTLVMMYCINRTYAETLLSQGKLLLGTAGFMLVGVIWIRRILSFEG
jgi:tight adherence protein B